MITSAFTLFSITPAIQFLLPTQNALLNVISTDQGIFELLFILSEILTTIAVLGFVLVTMSYVTDVNHKLALMIIFAIALIPTLAFFLDFFELAFFTIQVSNFLIIASLIPLVFKKWDFFQKFTQNTPIFILVALLVALSNIIFTFLDSNLMIWLEIVTRMSISFIVPFVLINLEYNLIAAQKFQLKDKYSHDLAQVLQKLTAEHYLISAGVSDKIDLQENIKKIDSSLDEIVALITLIRDL
ncbi:MAG: hypothetical protein KAT16_09180 [Candidatus Heimdallarchaeota archaeon]|nr:hypothetical protein [Candidatus Heimdallarchaeota archaeon]